MDRPVLALAGLNLLTLVAGLIVAVQPVAAAVGPARTERIETTGRYQGDFLLHVPDGLLEPAPLVVALHALAQEPETMQAYSRLEQLADEQGFVVAFPRGQAGTWNAGGCCAARTGKPTGKPADDVAFLDEVLASIAARVPIDPDRIAMVGGSNGAMMALRYACERPGVLASVGMVSGGYVATCTPRSPVAVLALHGANDTVIPLTGGRNALLGVTFPALDRALEPFRRAGGEVVLQVVAASGHEWMTLDRNGVDASRALWDFIRDHPRLPQSVNGG